MGRPRQEKLYHLFRYDRRGTQYWYFWYYDEQGIRKKVSCTKWSKTRFDAEQFAERFFARKNQKTIAEHAKKLFDEDSAYWVREKAYGRTYKPSTIRQYQTILECYIIPLYGSIPLVDVSTSKQEIEKKLLNIERSSRTKNIIIKTLNRILADAYRKNEITERVVLDSFSSTTEKVRSALSNYEMQILFPDSIAEATALWDDQHGALFPTMCIIAVSCGLRSGEIRALTIADISDDYRLLFIDKAIDTDGATSTPKKSSKKDVRSRVVPIPKRTKEYLKAWEQHRGQESDLLFHIDGGIVRPTTILRRLRNACSNAGFSQERVDSIDVHSLRYTYNSVMSSRVSHDLLREWIGHRSEQMTQHYYAPSLTDKAREYQQHQHIVDRFFDQ